MAREIKQKRSTLHERKTSLDSIKQLMQKSPSRAKGDLMRHLEKYPDDMYAWHYYGKLAKDAGDFREAELAFTKVAESKSWNKYAGIVGLGDIARNQGNRILAKKYYRQAINENPNEPAHTYCALARVECLDENYAEALRILESARVQNNDILIEMMRIYVLQNDESSALTIAANIYPTNDLERRAIIYERSKLAIAKNHLQEAKMLLAMAKEYKIKDTEYYKILNTEASIATTDDEIAEAIRNCEDSIRDGATIHGDMHVTLGRIKQRQGKYHEALDNYRLATEIKGVSNVTQQAANLYRAIIYLSMGDDKKAEEALKESLKIDREPYESAVESLCGIYYKQGRYDEIKSLLAKYSGNVENLKLISALKFIEIMLKKATGETLPRRSDCTYREKQAIDYNKKEAIEHIKSRHQDAGIYPCDFAPTVDIEKLYDEALIQLTEESKVASDMMDKYVIDYPNAGCTQTGEIADLVTVITLPNTFDIITMYPEKDLYLIRKSDIKKSLEEEQCTQRANSRITKFNSRFANFTPPKK